LRRGKAKIGPANRSLFCQRTKEFKNGNTGTTGKIQKFQNVSFSGPTSSSLEVSYKKMKIGETGQKRQTPLISLLYYSSILLPLCRVISPQSSSFLIHDPIIVKYPLWKLEGIPDKFIQSNLVTNSYSGNNLETNKNEEKNIFGDSFEFTLKENGMKYVGRNDMKFELCGMKKITMESSSNGKEKKKESIRQLPLIRSEAISNIRHLRYHILTMGKIKRLPLRGDPQCSARKPIPCKPSCKEYMAKFDIKKKMKDLEDRIAAFKIERARYTEVREYLTHVTMHYQDPNVIARAMIDYDTWTEWERKSEESFGRHLDHLDTEFKRHLAEKTKKVAI
jgi:hypothetical protein